LNHRLTIDADFSTDERILDQAPGTEDLIHRPEAIETLLAVGNKCEE